MQQFDLSLWLQDKSRKVVTRDGRPVRIVCTDLKNDHPIIAAIKGDNGEMPYYYDINGKCLFYDSKDIFFADEEEELTEFEKELRYWIGQSLCNYENNGCVSDNMSDSVNIYLKDASKKLLGLARKELGLVDNTCGEYALNEVYKRGKQDALKDLPKWKKFSEEYEELDSHVILLENNERVVLTEYLEKGDYYIDLEDLKKLPKEG